ncbi:MAG: transcriptional regulator [Conexibacter sp.]|nr:transcriptional regulator [Conexibacter sp.]
MTEVCALPGHAGLRSDARRNQRTILQAAARLLAEDPSASMQAIADAAGVSRPTVYRRFPRRDELIDAIRAEAMAEVLERLEAAAASQEPAAAALERLIRELAGVAARYPLLMELFRKTQHEGPPPQKRALPQAARAFDALVARGLRDGTLRAGLRADVLRQVTIGGLAVALRLGHETGRDSDEIGSDVASIVLGGVRATG